MTAGVKRDDEATSLGPDPGRHSVAGERLGPYRLIYALGEGGMGVVHLALDPTGRAVAVKVLREHIAHDREARDRLRREVETLSLVQDDRVAAVLDADTEGPRPYIVTRYIPGPALDRVVSQNGPLQGEALLRLGRGLWGALNVIHEAGVVHRDLKPANVVLLDGDPVVIDFGIAHVADDIRLTITGLVMGTPGYLSPEVVAGAPVTEAADWWGWAATLAFAASGAPPFGRGPMDVVLDRVRRGDADLSGVDRHLVPLLMAALSPVPSQRPHADEVVHGLDRYAAGEPPTLAIPLAGVSPSWPNQRPPSGPARGPALPASREPAQEAAQEWLGDRQPDAATTGELESAATDRERRPGQPDPRTGVPPGVGTTLALLVGVLGVAAAWPVVAIALVVGWSWSARLADRSATLLMTRRQDRGRRRSDVPVAVVASPWHAVVAALSAVLTISIPALVAAGSTFSVALLSAAVAGGDPQPNRSLPLVAGGLLGLLMLWWGPGGAALQRGSGYLLRAGMPGRGSPFVGVTDFVVATFALIGVGLGAWVWVRNGQPDWWPWPPGQYPDILRYLH